MIKSDWFFNLQHAAGCCLTPAKQDQGGEDDQRNHHGGRKDGGCVRKGGGIGITGPFDQTAKNDAALAGHKIGARQRTIVDRHRASHFADAGFVAKHQGNRRHEGHNREESSPQTRNQGGGEKNRQRQHMRKFTTAIEQMSRQLFQRSVDQGKIVKQGHRKDHVKDTDRPHADHFRRFQVQDETANDVRKGHGKKTGINFCPVAETYGNRNCQNNNQADHIVSPLHYDGKDFIPNPVAGPGSSGSSWSAALR